MQSFFLSYITKNLARVKLAYATFFSCTYNLYMRDRVKLCYATFFALLL